MSRVIRRFSSPAVERGPLLRIEAHPDRQQRERGAAAEESIAGGLDLADRDALDVVLAVGEQDDGRPDRVGGQVLGGLLHRGDVVRVDADLLRQGRVEALAVRARDRAQAAGERARPSPGCSGGAGRRSPGSRSPSPRTGRCSPWCRPRRGRPRSPSTRSAIDSSAAANWSRLALSLRIDAEKSRTRTTSERSGAAALVGVAQDAAGQQRRDCEREEEARAAPRKIHAVSCITRVKVQRFTRPLERPRSSINRRASCT